MTRQATPRPWTILPFYDEPWNAADADFALRAVNAHDDLVAALRALVEAKPVSDWHTYKAARDNGKALLRDLSPKEEGPWLDNTTMRTNSGQKP